jgi:hypothetical protein
VYGIGTLLLDHPAKRGQRARIRERWKGRAASASKATRPPLHPRMQTTRTPSTVSSAGWSPVCSVTTLTVWPRRISSVYQRLRDAGGPGARERLASRRTSR